MRHFLKLSETVDTTALSVALQLHPELWNVNAGRKNYEKSPHRYTSDIWLRYNDLKALDENNYKEWTKQHDSVWLPAADKLPQLRPIVFSLMAKCEAVRLGGILITKIPARQSVLPHTDKGWHPQYYNVKLYIPLQTNPQCVVRVEDEKVVMSVGEVWYFDNTKVHEVVNNGPTDRVTLIICLRVDQRLLAPITNDELDVKHHFSEGLYAREMQIPRDRVAITHIHKYDHFSILAQGRVQVVVDGLKTEYIAPACILIKKNQRHSVLALEDSVWFCIHATEETETAALEANLVEQGAAHAV